MKLGLEALQHANDSNLNREAVEVATITVAVKAITATKGGDSLQAKAA